MLGVKYKLSPITPAWRILWSRVPTCASFQFFSFLPVLELSLYLRGETNQAMGLGWLYVLYHLPSLGAAGSSCMGLLAALSPMCSLATGCPKPVCLGSTPCPCWRTISQAVCPLNHYRHKGEKYQWIWKIFKKWKYQLLAACCSILDIRWQKHTWRCSKEKGGGFVCLGGFLWFVFVCLFLLLFSLQAEFSKAASGN